LALTADESPRRNLAEARLPRSAMAQGLDRFALILSKVFFAKFSFPFAVNFEKS
jgi:hypothetical protein